jgi:hypothetical protein
MTVLGSSVGLVPTNASACIDWSGHFRAACRTIASPQDARFDSRTPRCETGKFAKPFYASPANVHPQLHAFKMGI